MSEFKIKGIAASPGIAIGTVFLYSESKIEIKKYSNESVETEIQKLSNARELSKNQLIELRDKTLISLGKDKADIFDGHITMIEDSELLDDIIEKITDQKFSAEYALNESIEEYSSMLANLEDEYFKERSTDLKDIGRRWLNNIGNKNSLDLSSLPKGTIIVSTELTPSDTAQIDLENVFAFVVENGGRTSHSSIMASSLEIPAVVGCGEIMKKLENGQKIIVDGVLGLVYVNPNEETLKNYVTLKENFISEKNRLKDLKCKKATSLDGYETKIFCNIGSPNDIDAVIKNGGEGVGLYRSEFLFMDKKALPTEDEQFEAYKIVAEKMENKTVIIRTMDIGGDKQLSYLGIGQEMNPFLGWRAIRICLENQKIFKTQLKAILRSSVYGDVKIMLPMIINLTELRNAKKIIEECKEELKSKNIPFDKNIEVGIMVETPSVAIRAEHFAKECDFFSIGTNDLTQYMLAVDRGNQKVSKLYDAYNPSVLSAIKMIIDGGHKSGIPVFMCGELAGDDNATEILFGMGLDEFSMSPTLTYKVKEIIRNIKKTDAEKLVDKILKLGTSEEVKEEIIKFKKEKARK